MTVLDAIIVGQGLAGTALAWHLIDAGWHIAVLDDGAPISASKVSAGLFTPIMGKNFTRNDDAAIAAARTFYQAIEVRTGARFFRDIPAVRLFATAGEQLLWERRREPLLHYLVSPQPEPLLPPDIVRAQNGGFVMRSAQLDTAAYLAASHGVLPVVEMRVDPQSDLRDDGRHLSIGHHTARRVIFCEGFSGAQNPYFPGLSHRNAKGEILLIRLAHALAPTSVHRRIWMAPMAEPDMFRVGATFDWVNLDHVPTANGRHEIETELRQILACPYEVVGHTAGVRPIIRRGAHIGVSPRDARVFMFNGLGTKGATRAPLCAELLARHLVDGAAIPAHVDIGSLDF